MRVATPLAALAVVLLTVACDDPVAPNTPVGLRVWAEIQPRALRISDSTQSFRIRVYVSNPTLRPITVVSGGPPFQLTSDPANSIGLSESFRIGNATSASNAGPNTDWFGDSLYHFLPHQTSYAEQSFTIAQWRRGGWPLVEGDYRVRSYFNGREGAPAPFRLVH